MQVFCPQCAASNEVAPSATGARCSACGAGLPVHMPGYGPPDAGVRPHTFGLDDMAAVPRVTPPKVNFVWNEQQLGGGAWGVVVGNRGCAGVVWVILALGAIAAAPLVWLGADGDPVAPCVVLGSFGLFFGYFGLCWAVNRGSIRVDQNWLFMGRGPIPQLGNQRVPTATIAVLRPVRVGTVKGATTTSYFSVQSVQGDGTLTTLPFGWMPRERAAYVCERLNMMVRDVQKRSGLIAPPVPMQPGQF